MTLNDSSLITSFDEKPADCTCDYPEVRYRNMSGHAPSCPVHIRFMEKLSYGASKLHKQPSATYRIHATDRVELIVIPTEGNQFADVDFNHEGRLVFEWLQSLPAATYMKVIDLIKERQ